jgi:hypothetical protein
VGNAGIRRRVRNTEAAHHLHGLLLLHVRWQQQAPFTSDLLKSMQGRNCLVGARFCVCAFIASLLAAYLGAVFLVFLCCLCLWPDRGVFVLVWGSGLRINGG